MEGEQPAHQSRDLTGLQVALALLGVLSALFVWNVVRGGRGAEPSHALYLVPPVLALAAGLLLAAGISRLRRRWPAVLLALVGGLILGEIAGVAAFALVAAIVGPAVAQSSDPFAGNEAVVAAIVSPLECATVAGIGALRAGRRRPAAAGPPVRASSPRHPLLADPMAPLMPHAQGRRQHQYRLVLILGLAIFAALTAATAQSGSHLAVIAVLVVGSFFVPVVYVEYIDEIDAFGGIPRGTLVRVGLLTALLGIPSAGFLEAVEHAGAGALVPALLTGFTEEGVKILLVVLLIRRTRYRFELDGVIYGAAAGMGFAAFEDAGYAIAALAQGGIPDFLSTLWLRQALGPFGHGTWTAAIAAVIWRRRYSGQRRGPGILGAYATSGLLHAAWDWDPLTGAGSFVWLLAVGAISIAILRARVRAAIAQEQRIAAGVTAGV